MNFIFKSKAYHTDSINSIYCSNHVQSLLRHSFIIARNSYDFSVTAGQFLSFFIAYAI
jgi:hypothetical protein